MALLPFHSHHPLSCKGGNVYLQALQYNMIISDGHIFQEEFNNLTRIILTRTYPLHLIFKNIKKALTHNHNHLLLLSQETTHTNKYSPYHNSSFKHRQIISSKHPEILARNCQ